MLRWDESRLYLAWMGTAILAGGIVVVLSGDGCVGSVIEV